MNLQSPESPTRASRARSFLPLDLLAALTLSSRSLLLHPRAHHDQRRASRHPSSHRRSRREARPDVGEEQRCQAVLSPSHVPAGSSRVLGGGSGAEGVRREEDGAHRFHRCSSSNFSSSFPRPSLSKGTYRTPRSSRSTSRRARVATVKLSRRPRPSVSKRSTNASKRSTTRKPSQSLLSLFPLPALH